MLTYLNFMVLRPICCIKQIEEIKTNFRRIFMFILDERDFQGIRSQFVTASRAKRNISTLPLALTGIAPVGLLFYSDPKQAFQIGSELAAMTHGHPSGYLSAGFLAALIACINNGNSLSDSIQLSLGILNEYIDCEEPSPEIF